MPKLTDPEIAKATEISADDRLYLVDVSDTTDDPAGTSKYVEVADLRKTPPQSITITRNAGQISRITKADETEIDITRDEAGLISQVEDGTHSLAIVRDGSDQITAINVTNL